MGEEIVTTSFVKRMVEEIEDLKKINQQHRKINGELRNKIKEVREYMDKHKIEEVYLDCKLYETQAYKDILEILDKGEER